MTVGKMYPKISIVIPTLNQGQYIEKTLTSLLDQNYPSLEIIVTDGGSTDDTISILKKYESRITYWKSERDTGQSNAINKGIKRATGDIINWLNSDDYLEIGSLQRVAEEFMETGADVVCGYSSIHFTDSTVAKRTTLPGDKFGEFLSLTQIMQPSTFWKKEVFDRLTPVEESLHFMMDHYLWLKYLTQYGTARISYIDDTLAHVLMHEDAKSYKDLPKFRKDRTRIYSPLIKALKGKAAEPGELKFSPQVVLFTKEDIRDLKFYFYFLSLFSRDVRGRREKVHWNILGTLLLKYPVPFFRYFLKKLIKG